MPIKDLELRRSYNRNYYHTKTDKTRKVSLQRDRIRKIKEWVNEYKSVLRCEKCGEDHPATLQFHHRDPDQKDFAIGEMHGQSKERVLDEILKCEVLCANCHAKLHWTDREMDQHAVVA